MAGKIFVNYRREDGAASAARLRDRLAQAFGAANIFMDVDNLLAGQRFDRELEKALAGTGVFLAVIGPRWSDILAERATRPERDYVRDEIASALARGITVIPVLVERAQLPRAGTLPEDLRALVLHQKHDLTHERFGRDSEELIGAIRAGRKGSVIAPSGGFSIRRILAYSLVFTAALFAINGQTELLKSSEPAAKNEDRFAKYAASKTPDPTNPFLKYIKPDQAKTPDTATLFRLRSECVALAEALLERNMIGSALTKSQVSRFDPATSHCYVELTVQTADMTKPLEYVNRTLFDGQTNEILAIARWQNGIKFGMVNDMQHMATNSDNAGWDDAVAYINKMITENRSGDGR